jgi:hypothetical protein
MVALFVGSDDYIGLYVFVDYSVDVFYMSFFIHLYRESNRA